MGRRHYPRPIPRPPVPYELTKDCRVTERACGGWLAISLEKDAVQIGVTASTREAAVAEYRINRARWRQLLTRPTGQEETMTGKIRALVGCQNEACAAEVSYPLDLVRLWKGQPVCEPCWDDTDDNGDKPDWIDLPPVTLADLCD